MAGWKYSILALALVACDADTDIGVQQLVDEPHYLYGVTPGYWPTLEIPVCWWTSGFANEKAWVQDELTSARSWSAFTNFTFTGWGTCSGDPDAIRITIGNSMSSEVGQRSDGEVEMTLDFTSPQTGYTRCTSNGLNAEECIRACGKHEFGHALGFAHEHNRPDTDTTACTSNPTNILGDTLIGDWDLDSIMGYCNFATELSLGDELGVVSAYGGPFPGWSACTTGEPCADGVGDCDSDAECVSGTCAHDVGAYFGWSSTADVCIDTSINWGRCTPDAPCPAGLGDCDSDADCMEGTICGFNIGADFGLDSTLDLCITN